MPRAGVGEHLVQSLAIVHRIAHERVGAGRVALAERSDQQAHRGRRLRHSAQDVAGDAPQPAYGDCRQCEWDHQADGDRDRVFERFYRADSARSSRDGGAGLGLAIAQWIVDLHDGEIRAERRTPHGCRMVVTIPNRRGGADAPRREPAMPRVNA